MGDPADIRNAPTYVASTVDAQGNPIPAIQYPLEPLVLEKAGAAISFQGVVESNYQGTAVVSLAMVQGGTIGVWTALAKLKVGAPAVIQGTVVEGSREKITVAFTTPNDETQLADLDRAQATIV